MSASLHFVQSEKPWHQMATTMSQEHQAFYEAMREALQQLIRETESSVRQLERTLEGVQQRLDLEERHLELLREKYHSFENGSHSTEAPETSIATYVAKVLTEQNEPMRATDIARQINEMGISGGALNSVVSALRRRTDMFERVSRGLYQLRSNEPDTAIIRRRRNRPLATAR